MTKYILLLCLFFNFTAFSQGDCAEAFGNDNSVVRFPVPVSRTMAEIKTLLDSNPSDRLPEFAQKLDQLILSIKARYNSREDMYEAIAKKLDELMKQTSTPEYAMAVFRRYHTLQKKDIGTETDVSNRLFHFMSVNPSLDHMEELVSLLPTKSKIKLDLHWQMLRHTQSVSAFFSYLSRLERVVYEFYRNYYWDYHYPNLDNYVDHFVGLDHNLDELKKFINLRSNSSHHIHKKSYRMVSWEAARLAISKAIAKVETPDMFTRYVVEYVNIEGDSDTIIAPNIDLFLSKNPNRAQVNQLLQIVESRALKKIIRTKYKEIKSKGSSFVRHPVTMGVAVGTLALSSAIGGYLVASSENQDFFTSWGNQYLDKIDGLSGEVKQVGDQNISLTEAVKTQIQSTGTALSTSIAQEGHLSLGRDQQLSSEIENASNINQALLLLGIGEAISRFETIERAVTEEEKRDFLQSVSSNMLQSFRGGSESFNEFITEINGFLKNVDNLDTHNLLVDGVLITGNVILNSVLESSFDVATLERQNRSIENMSRLAKTLKTVAVPESLKDNYMEQVETLEDSIASAEEYLRMRRVSQVERVVSQSILQNSIEDLTKEQERLTRVVERIARGRFLPFMNPEIKKLIPQYLRGSNEDKFALSFDILTALGADRTVRANSVRKLIHINLAIWRSD